MTNLHELPAVLTDAPTVAEVLRLRSEDDNVGLRFEDRSWTWREFVRECERRAGLLQQLRQPGPFHVGVLLDNVPEFVFLMGAAGLAGAVVVALNPTRSATELAGDIAHTDCQMLVTESRHRHLLGAVEQEFPVDRIFDADDEGYLSAVSAAPPLEPAVVDPDDLFMLIFTSGTSGRPKAVKCSHRKVVSPGVSLRSFYGFSPDDVIYVSMPLFHSNSVFVGWSPALASGATLVLRRKFSASGFVADVHHYGVTYFNYVGKPLTYILASPPRPDDSNTRLRLAIGNEGMERDIKAFEVRFGCKVTDGFGSTEGGVTIQRTPDTPPGSIGRGVDGVAVANQETGEECAVATFDEHGVLTNPEEAIGELVNTAGGRGFEGYYRNEEAEAARTRNGWYWSGDLGYVDENGFFYFAGRTLEWLRVDGENIAAAPIEAVLHGHPDVLLAAVYAVPAIDVGDDAMAALLLRDGSTLSPASFGEFMRSRDDMGAKWLPRYVRIVDAMPQTATNKVLKRELARERWNCDGAVWFRPGKAPDYRPLTPDDVARIETAQRQEVTT